MKTKMKRATTRAKRREEIVSDAPKLHATFQPGDVAHQGDLIIVCITELPTSAKARTNRQLADGSTQGSRHILTVGEVYDVPPRDVAAAIVAVIPAVAGIGEQYMGPVFIGAGVDDQLTHPEHGNQGFPQGAVCAVVYQRSLDAEEREQRVRD